MKIGIDASKLIAPVKTGVDVYAEKIIRGLLDLDRQNEYILYSYDKLPNNYKNQKIIPFFDGRGWIRGRLSLEILLQPPEVLFVPANSLPMFLPAGTIAAVQDVGFLKFPKNYTSRAWRYLKRATEDTLRRADAVLVPSQSTMNEIKKYYPWTDEAKLHYVPLGVDARQAHFGLPEKLRDVNKYFLFVGRLDYRKNVVRLVRAYDEFRSSHPSESIKLVLVGQSGVGYDEIAMAIRNAKYHSDIIETGYVESKYLPTIYKRAAALTFPTLYEGFGFPILEAYRVHRPVLCGDNSSQPEVAGNIGVLVDAENERAIVDGMERVLTVKIRNSEYDEIVGRFSWYQTAQKTLEIINSLGSE